MHSQELLHSGHRSAMLHSTCTFTCASPSMAVFLHCRIEELWSLTASIDRLQHQWLSNRRTPAVEGESQLPAWLSLSPSHPGLPDPTQTCVNVTMLVR